jgi:hypothetical protein
VARADRGDPVPYGDGALRQVEIHPNLLVLLAGNRTAQQ